MKEVIYNGNKLELNESVETLPITRYMQFNRFLIIDSGIGSDINSIDSHISIIRAYLGKEDIKNADKEILNMRQSILFALENVSPQMMAFTSLIESVNGKKVKIKSDEQAQKLIEQLSYQGMTFEKAVALLGHAKKKLIQNLKRFFRNKLTTLKRKRTTKD